MTDNEIIKALDHCKNGTNCRRCPYFKCSAKCVNDAMGDALSLINRQKAEISSKQYMFDNLQKQFDEVEQELHYLNNVEIPYLYSFTADKDTKLETLANILLRARNKAIKEFAERLKDTQFKHGNDYMIYAENIDNLVKEMVGENND